MRTGAITVVVLSLAGLACDGTDESAGMLVMFSPDHAYTDSPVPALLRGGPFRPSFSIDTSNGSASSDVRAFAGALLPAPPTDAMTPAPLTITGLPNPVTLTLDVPPGVPAGFYDVELRDPRGRVSFLPKAFRSLGPDRDPPEVSLVAPLGGTFVVVGSHIPVNVSADDGDGQLASLSWMVTAPDGTTQSHDCPSPQNSASATCTDGEFIVPDGDLDSALLIRTVAQDRQGNVGAREDTLLRAYLPVITSVVPAAGPAMGMTEIVVRGTGFTRATRVLIDGVPILKNGGTVENDLSTIRGFTTAHDPGSWPVVVQTGERMVFGPQFTFVPAPVVRRVSPDAGPAAGGTMVTIVGSHFVCEVPGTMGTPGTQFSVGAGVVRVTVPISDCGPTRVLGMMPAYPVTPDGTGTVSMFATDPAAGESELPNAFTYSSLPP